MESASDLRASVVIPVRNGGELLRVQLEALLAQDDGAFEVVVSDNGSTDHTPSIVEEYRPRFRALRLVDSGDRAGVSHARNVGAAAARSPLVLFCDADDQVDSIWVSAMVHGLRRYDLVGGLLDPVQLSDPQALTWRATPPTDQLPVAMRYLPYATGANLGVRREVFKALRGFDVTFHRGHEEVDFAWRAQLSGFSVGFVPDAVIAYRLRADLRSTMKQTFHYGRTYSQLFSRHRSRPIPRTPVKREIRTYGILLRQGVQALRSGRPQGWLCTMSWTVGRLWGDLRYGVRAPL